jgi:arylsulfatase A-like enzyme
MLKLADAVLQKWHAGSSCEANLPVSRGFDTSYGYLGGSEGHYNQHEGNGQNSPDGTTRQPSNPTSPVDLWVNDAPGYGLNGTYNAFAYTAHHVGIIEAAAAAAAAATVGADNPFFVYHAWQEAHVPNEVPIEYEDPSIDFLLRRVYEGMVHCMDSGIGNITAALKKTGAFEKTLIV